jgi:hypothetical protein
MGIFVEALRLGLRRAADAGDLRAGGIAADVHIQLPEAERADGRASSDAINVQVENQAGEAFEVFLPYAASRVGAVTFGRAFAVAGSARLFGANPSPAN